MLSRRGVSAVRRWRPASGGAGRPRGSEFVFARLRYESGDWDYNPKVAANVLDSIVAVHVDSGLQRGSRHLRRVRRAAVLSVRVHDRPQARALHRRASARTCGRFADAGGLLFSDDCNHDVNGLYARVVRAGDAQATFPGRAAWRSCRRRIRSIAASSSSAGPPQTSHELNGWGDNIVHEYLRGIERRGRLAVLYSNKDYGCEWDYDWRNKRFLREDNTKFAVNLVVYAMTQTAPATLMTQIMILLSP